MTMPVPDRLGTVAPGTPPPVDVQRLIVLLVRPSRYDDEGYIMRYWRGVLPSNTLATLAGLTREVARTGDLGVGIETVMLDETVQKISARRLARRYGRPGTRVVVALCGVQTNQFPRATDLAREFQAAGLPVMIGGFHVSGAIAMSRTGMPPECQALLDAGVTLVRGEVEEVWGDLLRDALHGCLRTYYAVATPPDLTRAELPEHDPALMRRFAYPSMGTIDAGRGCPFRCSFCTIINVQGRTMRCRAAAAIIERIRANYARKVDYYFFTDDNFARNPQWEAILDGLIALRREGLDIHFMMQIDTQAGRLPNFMIKAFEAGCTQVFIGMETLNPDNIVAAGKLQNRVEDYAAMIDGWHAHGIACHVGYIIGFPFDTVESVADDVRRLRDEIKVDQASFFMLTPLPGSADHRRMQDEGAWLDADYNRFDSFHPVMQHPRMSQEGWFAAYRRAWRDFYTTDAMKAILNRATDTTYWGVFRNFLWYKYAALIEQTHPMICGFLRCKDRLGRRPGVAIASRGQHIRQRLGEWRDQALQLLALYFEMQEVWLATRGRARIQSSWDLFRARYDRMRDRLGTQVAGMQTTAGEAWQRAGRLGREQAEELTRQWGEWRQEGQQRLGVGHRALQRLNPLAIRMTTRQPLNQYWRQTVGNLRQGRIFRINPLRLALNLGRDARLCMIFSLVLLAGYSK